MRKLLPWIGPILLATLLLLLLLRPDAALIGARNGLLLWAQNVLPSLLPYFILCELIIESGILMRLGKWTKNIANRLFRLPADGFTAILLGWLSGSPSGARIAGQMADRLSPAQIRRFCAASAMTGPLFLVGSVGTGMLSDQRAGIALLLASLTAAFANGLLWRSYGETDNLSLPASAAKKTSLLEKLPSAISGSTSAVLSIGAAITLFSVLLTLMQSIGVLPLLAKPLGMIVGQDVALALVAGVIELTNGCAATAALPIAIQQRTAIIAGLAGFGGLSVAAQASVFLQGIMPMKTYLLQRVTQGILGYLAGVVFSLLMLSGQPVSTQANKSGFCIVCVIIFVLAALIAYLLLRLGIIFKTPPKRPSPGCRPNRRPYGRPSASCANPAGSCAPPPSYPVRVSPDLQTDPPHR